MTPVSTIPHFAEALLAEAPEAPALVLRRAGARDRVWCRAAVEHRAVGIAGFCVAQGLRANAAVLITAVGPLDVMAAVWFVLATGRRLGGLPDAAFALDDAAFQRARADRADYTLCTTVGPADPALAEPAGWSHERLMGAVLNEEPIPLRPLVARALRALVRPEPWIIEGANLGRLAISAA